jgi:hypothetical protein
MKTRRFRGKKHNKTYKGGKTFASNKPVQLFYNENEVVCDVCKKNNYKETTGALDKSKVRSGIGQLFFGDAAEILDTTSVIIYTCTTCGLCKIIRNKDPIRIIAK